MSDSGLRGLYRRARSREDAQNDSAARFRYVFLLATVGFAIDAAVVGEWNGYAAGRAEFTAVITAGLFWRSRGGRVPAWWPRRRSVPTDELPAPTTE